MAAGVQTILTYIKNHPDKAMDIFNVLNKLSQSNPNSQVARDWQAAQQSALDPSSISDMLDAEVDKGGYEGWDDEGGMYEQMYGKKMYDKKHDFFVNKALLPMLGDAAKIVGEGIGAKKSILGAALMAAAPTVGHINDPFDKTSHESAAQLGMRLAGAKESGTGAIAALIGKTAGDRLQQLAGDLENREEKARLAQYQANEQPTGKFWDQVGRMGK